MGSCVVHVSPFHQTSWKFGSVVFASKRNLLGGGNMHEQVGLSRHNAKQTMVGFDDYAANIVGLTVPKCRQNSLYTRAQGTITVLSI